MLVTCSDWHVVGVPEYLSYNIFFEDLGLETKSDQWVKLIWSSLRTGLPKESSGAPQAVLGGVVVDSPGEL